MTEIRFYHLRAQTIEQALPAILTKALAGGRRVMVRLASDAAVNKLSDYLWTYRADSFLPHGSERDGFPASQPVWLGAGNDNPSGADTLILAGGKPEAADTGQFSLCCEMFEDQDREALEAARARWKSYKDAGHTITYWQQNDQGGWDKKA